MITRRWTTTPPSDRRQYWWSIGGRPIVRSVNETCDCDFCIASGIKSGKMRAGWKRSVEAAEPPEEDAE
jgi:hypothetical protein